MRRTIDRHKQRLQECKVDNAKLPVEKLGYTKELSNQLE